MTLPAPSPNSEIDATTTRGRLINAGIELFTQQGYNHTGISAILKRAGVPKGCFYHHFASKKDFGLAVIDAFAAQHQASLDTVFARTDLGPLQRLREYFEQGTSKVAQAQFCGGCLAGNLSQELASQQAAFRERLQLVFAQWAACLEDCLREAQAKGEIDASLDTESLAQFLLSGWEGAIMQAKLRCELAPMQTFADTFFSQVLRVSKT